MWIYNRLKRDPSSVYENALNVARPPEVLRGVTRTLMPERLRSRVRQAISGANLVTHPRAQMDPAFIIEGSCRKEFQSQIEQLSKLLDLDLTSWSVN
jgi:hypothetical protein